MHVGWSLLFLALLTPRTCDALLVGARAPGLSAAARSTVRLGFFDNLFKPADPIAKAESIIGEVANPLDFSTEELGALKACSISEKSPCAGEEMYTTIPDAPASLLGDTFPNLPRSYYDIFRNARGVPVPPEVWPFVREKWPVLAEKTDEELMEALAPIKAVYVDIRSL